MASVRLLKKKVKRIVIEVLDDCDYIVENNGPKADKAEALMDEAVDFFNETIDKVGSAKSKSDYQKIKEEVDKKEEEFLEKLNKIQ